MMMIKTMAAAPPTPGGWRRMFFQWIFNHGFRRLALYYTLAIGLIVITSYIFHALYIDPKYSLQRLNGYVSSSLVLASAYDTATSMEQNSRGSNKFRHLNLTIFGNSDGFEEARHFPSNGNLTTDGADKAVCVFPFQDAFPESIMDTFSTPPTVNCSAGLPSLVYRDGDSLKLNTSKARSLKIIIHHCRVFLLQRKEDTDFQFREIPHANTFLNVTVLPMEHDQFYTSCFFQNQTVSKTFFHIIREKNDTEILYGEYYNQHLRENSPAETLSVLLLGIDGLSRQCLIRSMNKTRNYLVNNLNALELFKFNKVGENTFPNLLPLLSGWSKPEIMRDWYSGEMDEIDNLFLWNNFQYAGYRTSVVLDREYITAFHYLKKGWKTPNFDYYNRLVVLKSDRDREKNKNIYPYQCVGETPEISFLLNGLVQLATVFNNSTKPYFGLSFLNRLTHDNSLQASSGDELYLEIFQRLNNGKLLNNTVLIFFSDHGPRFGPARTTYHGMLESKTPFMFLVFPDWFRSKYPGIMNTLRTNQHRLTTMFDIHATLKELLTFQGTTGMGDFRSRGISLFHEIPASRTCIHADIPFEFCMCHNVTAIQSSPELMDHLTRVLIERINSMTEGLRDRCQELKLGAVNTVASFSDGQRTAGHVFKVIINTKPNSAVYEANLESSDASGSSYNVIGEITRLNMYKGQAECIQSEALRPFCLCKKNVGQ